MVRWTCIFVSGAFGRGKESSIGFTEGSEAAAALKISMTGMVLTLRRWGAERDKSSRPDMSSKAACHGRIWQGFIGADSVSLHDSEKVSFFNFCMLYHGYECKYTWWEFPVMMQDTAELHIYNTREDVEDWGGVGAVMDDLEEQRVLFAALDSF